MPRIAIISDIHGNLPALKAVFKKLDETEPDRWVCLGDIVGYGPKPSECIKLIMERGIPTVLGNHDAGVAGKLNLNHFRNPNKRLIEMTRGLISNDQLIWLLNLPYILEGENWLAAHATPDSPEEWIYIESAFKARDLLKQQNKHLCFVGHTHRPALVSENFGIVKYCKESKFLINPGSVGQSRDGDYRASCCILDTEKQEYKNIRVDYDIEETLTGLMKLGFSRREASLLMKV